MMAVGLVNVFLALTLKPKKLGFNPIQTGGGGGAFEVPLPKRLNNIKTIVAVYGHQTWQTNPKIYLGTFYSPCDMYINTDITMATKF